MDLADKNKIVSDYRKSSRRLIFLDYDGTLTPFFDRPEDAKPDGDLLKLLGDLASDQKNEVVLLSGRDRKTLDEWFDLDIGYGAEHGAWIKERGKEWEMIKPLRNDWKKEVRPVLESYVDKTPDSFIEEKEFSLAWHYRMVDEERGRSTAKALTDSARAVIPADIQILRGDKVIEVKNASVNKGLASLRWIDKKGWDFILALGDDWTDEDTFDVLPQDANSINVEPGPSHAKFSLGAPVWVLSLLKELVES